VRPVSTGIGSSVIPPDNHERRDSAAEVAPGI
jgi:hypothetical protein